jgi:N utilization substance protein A
MRSKVAVAARQSNVDPVGSCVGMKGQRIQKIVDELGGEKIDVVLWDADMSVYIANALSPAQVLSVDLSEPEKTATVVVPERMLSLAIGKEGQNARLAAKLTGWRIDIKSAAIPEEDQEEYVPDDEELARRAAVAMRAEHAANAAAAADGNNGFQPAAAGENGAGPKEERRKVRPNNTVVYQNVAYGPLPETMPGESVRLRDLGDSVEIRTDSGRTIATYPVQAGEPAEEVEAEVEEV